jgi:tetratricopeptide (TPR) repeat protein
MSATGMGGFGLGLVAGLVATLGGCGGASRTTGFRSVSDTEPQGERSPRLNADALDHGEALHAGDAAWNARLDEQRLREAIQAWRRALALRPDDPGLWTRLSRAYYFLADAHLSFDEGREEEMLETWDEGARAAERALSYLSPTFAQRMQAGGRIEDAAAALDDKAVGALFWRIVNLGKWASAKGFTTQLDVRNELRLLMGRCLALDPAFFHGGPHRVLGAYYARAPAMVGGDLERSQSHFEQSINLGPNYLATRVLYALFD